MIPFVKVHPRDLKKLIHVAHAGRHRSRRGRTTNGRLQKSGNQFRTNKGIKP